MNADGPSRRPAGASSQKPWNGESSTACAVGWAKARDLGVAWWANSRSRRPSPLMAARPPISAAKGEFAHPTSLSRRDDRLTLILYSPARRKAMNIPEKPALDGQAQALDMDRFRLRRFVGGLQADELEIRREAIDFAGVAAVFEGNPKAVLFHAVGPEGQELVGNVTASRTRMARAFAVAPDALPKEIQ